MAGIGGAIAGGVGKVVAAKLAKFAAEEITLQWRCRKDLTRMAATTKDLEAVLHDADDNSRRGGQLGEASRRWLMKFQGIAYDVDDVLDALGTYELINKSQSKVKVWFSRNNQLLHRVIMPHKIKSLRKKIDKIYKEGQFAKTHQTPAKKSTMNEPFAGSGVQSGEDTKTRMVGRVMERDKIIRQLTTSKANEDISIIPVVGLGGIGKTTLVESVLADKRVAGFDFKLFVHVSKPFDLDKIGRAILKSLNSNINLHNCTLPFLDENLKKELANKKYLIVLDDLWEENGEDLEKLKQMLLHGMKGSRILITTRNQLVVERLRTGFLANERKICPVLESDQINLGVLSSDDCWELMKVKAFGPDHDQSRLEDVGRQIAEKCGGLPLVANALGQVMSDLRDVKAWEDLRDTKVDLALKDIQKETLESLMLSYYYMKLEFKLCFTYLAAYPKGSVMNSNHLIQQWIALGYLCPGFDGQKCINYLLGMSFLQIKGSPSDRPSPTHATAPRELIMHDLVHDLASIIVDDEVIDLDATKATSWDKTPYCRHARLINYRSESEVFEHLPSKVRSLHCRDLGEVQLPEKAFSRSKYLRVLDLSASSSNGQSTRRNTMLASSIGQLKLLRYLDATGLPITSLTKTFHTLQNLETLILSNCLLETLPDNICCLRKLCYLDLSGSSSLRKLPTSLGKLSELSFLNLSGCSILQELPESIYQLTCLDHLDMSGCCALQKLPDKFGSLPKLSFLNLSSCSKLTNLPDDVSFPSLGHMNLSSCHELEHLPADFGRLRKLEFLNISDCYSFTILPASFCQLDQLKYLHLSDCLNLRTIPENIGGLVELQYLNLTSCSKIKHLPESLCKLLKLRRLELSYCMVLRKLPTSFGDLKLQILGIDGLIGLSEWPNSIGNLFTTLTQVRVTMGVCQEKDRALMRCLNLTGQVEHFVHEVGNGGCSSIVEIAGSTCSSLVLRELQNVRHLKDAESVKLRDKSDIRALLLSWNSEGGESVLEKLVPPRTLEDFIINGYMSKDFPNWMYGISSYLPSLASMTLSNLETCDNLPPFGGLPNLRSLCMENIPNIRKIGREFYGEGGPCMKLRVLKVVLMENLVEWWTTKSGEENEEFLIPNLHYLGVKNCRKLKFLPYPPRSMGWSLDNSDLVLPEQGFGKLSSYAFPGEMYIYNSSFPHIKWDGLQHFHTLYRFVVQSINGMRTLPGVIGCFRYLVVLTLQLLEDLETLPIELSQLYSLQFIEIKDCPKLACLPESMKYLTTLVELLLQRCRDLEILPEWLDQLISLKRLCTYDCPKLTSLPESIQSITAEIYIWRCPGLEGEGGQKIRDISSVRLFNEISKSWEKFGQPQERNRVELMEITDAVERTWGFISCTPSPRPSSLHAILVDEVCPQMVEAVLFVPTVEMSSSSSSVAMATPSIASLGHTITEKLTRENFLVWKAQVLPHIKGAGLMGYLDGSIKEPTAVIYSEKDVAGKKEITSSLNPEHAVWVTQD
ncbi:disease resistance protein RGA2-like [Triticum dicoccoides]|uniref:disease resistance protein RGA2-like n=1 Tax=Triticum dicoccoides TaxID=85692 RepID=UPI00188F9B57|nr:disease resistance protein RGA2-like [Triticum dicoccoides]